MSHNLKTLYMSFLVKYKSSYMDAHNKYFISLALKQRMNFNEVDILTRQAREHNQKFIENYGVKK